MKGWFSGSPGLRAPHDDRAERAAGARRRILILTLQKKVCCNDETLFHSRVSCAMLRRQSRPVGLHEREKRSGERECMPCLKTDLAATAVRQ